jgi:hypothetical protein
MSPPWTHTGMPYTGNADAARWLGGQLGIPAQLNQPAGPAQPRRWSSSTKKMIQRDHFRPRTSSLYNCMYHYVSLSLLYSPLSIGHAIQALTLCYSSPRTLCKHPRPGLTASSIAWSMVQCYRWSKAVTFNSGMLENSIMLFSIFSYYYCNYQLVWIGSVKIGLPWWRHDRCF